MLHRLRSAWRALLAALIAFPIAFTGAMAGSPTLVAQPGVTAPASIPELARALKYDVNLIYEYVYTNIEYSPTYGLKKGALGTLLDGSGNDFDQSALLVALLRASGYTASYKYGTIRLGPAAINAYFGVDVSDACPLARLLTNGGIPVSITVLGPPVCTSLLVYADIDHTWVSVTGGSLGATTYALDPSHKNYIPASGVNLTTATGYDQTAFLPSAKSGATITGNSIQNLSTANIATSLQTYAANLVSYIRNNNPTATTRDIIGGRYIQPLTQPYTPSASLPYQTPGDTPATWTGNVPDVYRTTLQIEIDGINKTYFGDEIYGHRLSVVYNGSVQPILYLDGIAQGTGTANAKTLSYSVTFPFCFSTTGPSSPTCGTGFTNIYKAQNVLKDFAGYTYAIIAGWDFTGRGMLEFHRRQLQVNRATGAADNSEAVLGEALNMIGYSWLAQADAADAVTDRLVGTKSVVQCAIGVAAQVGGPYVDLPGRLVGNSSLTNDLNRSDTTLFTSVGMGSALEWGTLAQDLSKVGVSAVSTVKLLDIANTQHEVIFDATSANWTGTVKPQLIDYADADKSQIESYINSGFRVILPKRGNLTEGIWTGTGYIGIGPTGTGLRRITYGISSNLKGGYSTFNSEPQFYIPELADVGKEIPPPTQVSSVDPIDLSSGAFLYDHDDLSIGSGNFPYGLAFRRSYNSNNLYAKGPLGAGWSHGFAISASANSDGLKGMGQDSPIDGAAVLAALHVAQDLFSDANKPFDKVLIATLVQKWLTDRLIDNTVNVTTGAQGEQFVLLADGSYNPQLGSSSRLTLKDGLYSLQYKDGTMLRFNGDGNISSWQVPTGLSVSFAYDASSPPLLTSVSNSIGRSLSLSYNGSKQLISVADNASPPRSVAYGYDAAGNLASFTDPLGNPTTFAYTPAGGGFPQGLLSQIFYPSSPTPFVTNAYDTLGRVVAQTNANGATWNYFFAGYRSEEDDPLGTQHVLYYNPRGKAQFDIQDAAGLNLLTRFTYDGLDRLTATVLPSGLATSYTYASSPNPWANNVATVTRSAASGPLAPTVTSYVYEPTFNKPAGITDALGRVTLVEYDPWTGNPLAVTADVGAAPHFNVRTTSTYNVIGLLASTTDPVGTVTQYNYDTFGNRLSTVADAGTGRLNLTTTFAYDARGDPLSVTDPRGNVTTSTYDPARRPVTTRSPPTSAAPQGVTTTNSYDADGRITQVQQNAGGSVLRSTSMTYTLSGKQATTTDANGNVTRFAYDSLDRLASISDAAGRVTTYAYDTVSRQTGTFNPTIQAAALLAQTYTPNGKMATLSDANGNTTSFAYDGFDRLATMTYPGGSTEAFTYDALDNVLTRKTRAGPSAIITFGYDTLNRLTTKTPPSGPVVTYSYDLAGRQTGVSDTSAAIPSVATPVSTTTYATNYTYDVLNRPTSVTWDPVSSATPPAAGTLVTFGHSYNAVNQRVGQTVSDNTWLAYPAATPATTAYSANNLNQYTAVGGTTPTYDGNGNLTSNGSHTYAYDAENRLLTATLSGNTATYQYDAQGRRKSRTVGGATTIFLTDADNREVLEYDGSTGAVLRWYAYGLGPNEVLGQMNVPVGTRIMPIPGMLGSIVGSVDSSTGAVSKASYLAYGGSAAPASPFAFTGQRFDSEAGLYYYRARHYSTAYGRFLQADPIGYDAGANLYAYVGNNPLNLIDPEGLSALETITGLAQTMVDPYVGFFDRSIVGTISTAVSFAPALFDPAFYASIQGLGAPGAVVGGIGYATTSAVGAIARGLGSAARNFNVYEVFVEAPITGASRSAHRASANQYLASQLSQDANFAAAFNRELGVDVLSHMQSGRSLVNPPGMVWHHPSTNPNVVHLIRSTEHTDPRLRSTLHPSGVGGFGSFYGP